MKRAEFTGSGPFAAFARKVAGLDSADGAMTEYQATADYAKAQDKGQDQMRPEGVRIQAAE
jgi:4-hydroxyphenylacetate 3-monooxygenase/chlorophenol-4-monooxygenase component 2